MLAVGRASRWAGAADAAGADAAAAADATRRWRVWWHYCRSPAITGYRGRSVAFPNWMLKQLVILVKEDYVLNLVDNPIML